MKNEAFVSVILQIDSAEMNFRKKVIDVWNVLHSNYTDHEILIIAQGPVKQHVNDLLTDLLLDLSGIRFIQLSSTVPFDVAWASGLENAIGDIVILFDYQTDPTEVITELVALCKLNNDVVVGVANQHSTVMYKVVRFLGDRILNAVDYYLPKNATGLRCLSRRAVNAVTSTGKFHHQLYMRIQKTGYTMVPFSYQQQPITPQIKRLSSGLRNMFKLLVFNSTKPLRWISGLGLFGSLLSLGIASYSILIHLFTDNVVPGWTTSVLFTSILFTFQFIILAFLGEYLARLLDEKEGIAEYSVVYEKNSQVMLEHNRLNVRSLNPKHL